MRRIKKVCQHNPCCCPQRGQWLTAKHRQGLSKANSDGCPQHGQWALHFSQWPFERGKAGLLPFSSRVGRPPTSSLPIANKKRDPRKTTRPRDRKFYMNVPKGTISLYPKLEVSSSFGSPDITIIPHRVYITSLFK